ncbi:ankyrin repeat domain-containing protein [Mycolicibacterium phlei]
MLELARYVDGPASVVIARDGDELVFRTEYDEGGRLAISESRTPVADFVAKGEGPWPWYDLGVRRDATLRVLDALGVTPPVWTRGLSDDELELFERASRGDSSVIELLAWGFDPDPVDPCGASPLWYAVRSLGHGIVVALIDAGADAGRRIELSARGDRFTTILHEIVRTGRSVALNHALARGVDPMLRDSAGATPLHVLAGDGDHVNPELVRALVDAGASVHAELPGGTQPIEHAARSLLPATVAALLDRGAHASRGLDALMAWWSVAADLYGYKAGVVCDVVALLRGAGAEVSDRHHELAATAGTPQVSAALRH